MNKVKKWMLCIVLALLCICQPMAVYASGTGHGGGGGNHMDGGTSYEGNYTFKDFLKLGINTPDVAAYGTIEAGKFIMLVVTTTWGVASGNADYKSIAESFVSWNDNVGTGEWVHVDANNNVTYDQELIDLLKQFLEEYAQKHPDEIEKINYRIIRTLSYQEAFEKYIDYRNVPEGDITVPEGSNTMDFGEKLWFHIYGKLYDIT